MSNSIARKYRDEPRPRQGLLRTREFLMKDLYTFDATPEKALQTYETVRRAYSAFFDEFKIPYLTAEADSGEIGGSLSHEYHFPTPKGEDNIITCNSCSYAINEELVKNTDSKCPKCDGGSLVIQTAAELGHTFYLGTKYSEPLEASVAPDFSSGPTPSPNSHAHSENSSDEASKTQQSNRSIMQMGCYGIGVSRIIAAVADSLADAKGLNWPRIMAPFETVIVPGKGFESDAAALWDLLACANQPSGNVGSIDAILDDRDKDMVWKLKDADLIGYPIIVVLGRSWRQGRRCEVQCRRLGAVSEVPVEGLRDTVMSLLDRL
ncbi:hypothetical protein MMC12_004451 [Toensbergia leucococca]|nr:hypothetical protein [Toensbergia leucococca]